MNYVLAIIGTIGNVPSKQFYLVQDDDWNMFENVFFDKKLGQVHRVFIELYELVRVFSFMHLRSPVQVTYSRGGGDVICCGQLILQEMTVMFVGTYVQVVKQNR